MTWLFRILSLMSFGRALKRGPVPTGKWYLRRKLHRQVSGIR